MVVMVLCILLIVGGFVLWTYNSLIKDKNRIELAETELKKYEEAGDHRDIDNARKYYAAVLRDYNTKVERFPFSLVAELFNFPKMHSDNFDEGL